MKPSPAEITWWNVEIIYNILHNYQIQMVSVLYIYGTFANFTELDLLHVSTNYCERTNFTFPKWPRPRTATHLKSVKLN